MRWYVASSTGAERWFLAGNTRDEAVEKGKAENYGAMFAIAPEVEKSQAQFYQAVADAIGWGFENADEHLAEENWIDFEDGFLDIKRDEIVAKLADWLPSVIDRPNWAHIDTSKAEEIHADREASDG